MFTSISGEFMKKILARIFCFVLLVCLAMSVLTGCTEGKWSGNVTMKDGGKVLSNGGFIAETEKYLYFINGVGGTYSNNKMGEPLKGALLVADKNDLTKTEVVVPKLMVASDYKAGVFIDGGYAYYGTPSVDKDSSGSVANYKMTFMRTKLDGSGQTDEFFTHEEFFSEYRIVKGAGENSSVCIYYYDTTESAIVCYDTSSKTSKTVAKTDDTAQESLDTYVFIENSQITDVVGFFTATVYEDEYDEKAAENANYSRITAGYNKVYAIKAGSETPELVVDGKGEETNSDDIAYQLSLLDDGMLFFTKSNKGVIKTFAITQANAVKVSEGWKDAKEVVNTDYVNKANLFIVPQDGKVENTVVYVLGEEKLYKTTLFAKDGTTKQPIATKDMVSEMLFIRAENNSEYLYYFNSSAELFKFDMANSEKQIRVSESTVATTWYDPERVVVGDKEYVFYCDDSTYGKSYVKYVDLDASVVEEDTDDDDKNDKFYIDVESIKNFGKITVQDQADVVTARITGLSSQLPEGGIGVDQEADQKYEAEYKKVKDVYENLENDVKEKVSQTAVDSFKTIEKALVMAEKYKQLEGIRYIVTKEDEGADVVKVIYDALKEEIQEFKNSEEREAVDALINNQLKAHYSHAVEVFEATEEDDK